MTQNHTYMTQDELAAFNQANDTKLKGEHYLAVNPKTGEEGAWMFTSQTGWTDASKLGGPRTHYEDGTPVADFSYRNDWNPNWSIRLNDISNWAGGQGGGAGRTMLSQDQLGYAGFNDPYWRTSEGRQWVNQQAISGRSLEEIYREMAQMGERADKVRAVRSGSNPLLEGTSRSSGMMNQESRSNVGNSNAATSAMNSGFDELDTKWGRVARTGIQSWERGGDLMDWIGDAEGNYDGMSFDRLYDAYGGITATGQAPVMNPLIDTIWHDQQDIINMYNSGDFNPYYSPHHQTQQHRDRLREMGNDRHSLSSFDNRMQGNMMDYLYDKTKSSDRDTIAKRGEVMKKWQAYSNGANWDSLYNRRMDERTYRQMGLQDILGEYDSNYNAQFKGEAQGNPLAIARADMARQENDPSARRGFLGSYLDTKDKLAERTSVKSLFKEMEGFEGE